MVFSIARQVGLSVLGTLAASAVMTTLQAQWAVRSAAPAVEAASRADLPSLTAGGKFAARATSGNEPEPFVSLMQLPAVLPMFTAVAVPRLTRGMDDAAGAGAGLATIAEPDRAGPRRDIRRPQPPRRTEASVVSMAPLPVPQPAPPEDPSFWSSSKNAYRTVAAWSGAVVDGLLP